MVNEERAAGRRKEIIDACKKLYETMGFRDITIKEIAEFTSFTRPSIYNYFQTKEEIFLALFGQEYEKWTEDVDSLQPSGEKNGKLEFSEKIAGTLQRRELLLKLLSNNLNDMEQNSSVEDLVAFKVSYGKSIESVRNCLLRFSPELSEEEAEEFIFSFFPFVYGIYPYAAVSEEQRYAMEQAGVNYKYMTIYEIALLGARKLLGV